MPPQCGGPDIVGWSWDDVRHESVGGTRWGEYSVVGTWDGERLTLTEPPGPARWSSGPERDPLPCPVPDGGWVPPDPGTATQEALDRAIGLARSSEGFAGLWIDQGLPSAQLTEANANDPGRLVLVVASTGDLAALEADLRDVWGGSLCVAPAGRSLAELRPALRAVGELPGVVSSGYDEVRHRVEVTVVVATEQLQRDLDAEFGAGAVALSGVLVPVRTGEE